MNSIYQLTCILFGIFGVCQCQTNASYWWIGKLLPPKPIKPSPVPVGPPSRPVPVGPPSNPGTGGSFWWKDKFSPNLPAQTVPQVPPIAPFVPQVPPVAPHVPQVPPVAPPLPQVPPVVPHVPQVPPVVPPLPQVPPVAPHVPQVPPVIPVVSPSDGKTIDEGGPACCECVPFYLCEDGVINVDGAGTIDVRVGGTPKNRSGTVNVDVCPGDEGDICCAPPDADLSCVGVINHPVPVNPPVGTSCQCVVYERCDNLAIVSDGLGITSLTLPNGQVVSHSKCPHSLEVCCSSPLVAPATDADCQQCVESSICGPDGYIKTDGEGILDLRIGGGASPWQPRACPHNPSLVCCRSKGVPPVIEQRDPRYKSCGTRNVLGIGTRILGFKEGESQFGEFPWVATLLKQQDVMGTIYPLFLGGASLIHPKVVLTAAHKVQNLGVSQLLIRLGEWDAASTKETLPHQDVLVNEVIIHPNFLPGPLVHDVALLILKEAANPHVHITPICPAKDLTNVNPNFCVVNGWGVDEFSSGNYQVIMKSVRMPLVDKVTCQKLLRKTRLSRFFQLHNSFICAGGEAGVDACKGDGGGPLSCQLKSDPSRYVQVGITAWGVGCGDKDVPGVYADVTVHYDWIMTNLRSRYPETAAAYGDPSLNQGF